MSELTLVHINSCLIYPASVYYNIDAYTCIFNRSHLADSMLQISYSTFSVHFVSCRYMHVSKFVKYIS